MFTAPVRGVYLFTWTCYAPSAPGRVFLRKTGATVNQTESNAKGMTAVVMLAAGEQAWIAGTASYPLTWYGAGAHNGFSGTLIAAF